MRFVPVGPAGEIVRHVARLQPRRVHRGEATGAPEQAASAAADDEFVKEPVRLRPGQQPPVRGAERREMRDLRKAEHGAQVGPLGQCARDAAVVLSQELFEHETRDELWLREFPRAPGTRVRRVTSPRQIEGHIRNAQSALGGFHASGLTQMLHSYKRISMFYTEQARPYLPNGLRTG